MGSSQSKTVDDQIELVIAGWIRQQSNIYSTIIIPRPISLLICDFILIAFKYSSIMNASQAKKLSQLLSSKISVNSIMKAKLLHHGGNNGFNNVDIFNNILHKAPLLYIIESNHGHIFGGYTTKSNYGYPFKLEDEYAFLYVLCDKNKDKSNESIQPKIFNVTQNGIGAAITHSYVISDTLFQFGTPASLAICADCDERYDSWCGSNASCYNLPKGNILCGGDDQDSNGNYFFQVVDMEIYSL